MSHFAKVIDGVVVDVIVAEQDFINTGLVGEPSLWIQTSYNTRSGLHYGEDGEPDGGIALRKNYATIGGTYDAINDAFIPVKVFDSWLLNSTTFCWEPPIPYPEDGKNYFWNESGKFWELVPEE